VRVRVIAVGTRMPAWVRCACDDYLSRLTRGRLAVTLTEIETAARGAGRSGAAQRAIAAEGERLLAALGPKDHVVALDEHGRQFGTRELADWLGARMRSGEALTFLIGGPDGLAREVLSRSALTLSLSRLTLPHALVRVVLAEQLYRAHCILSHHPYHRD
jgi:23S rRNA (pseudouridine1915-N3)-methyltransferase